MLRLHGILAALALGTIPVVGAAIFLVLLQTSSLLEQSRRDEQQLAIQAGQTLVLINQPCGVPKDPHPCGTLADVNQTLATARGTLGKAEEAAISFDKHSGTLYTQEQALFHELDTTIGTANTTLAAVQGTAQGATAALMTTKDTITGLLPMETAATQAVSSLNAVLSQPSIPQVLAKAVVIEDNVALMTADGHRISKDAADEADKLAHPTKKTGFIATTDATLLYIHSRILPPLF